MEHHSDTSMAYAEVHFPLPVRHGYTYRVPAALQGSARVGCRVLAPLGPRRVTGFLVALSETNPRTELKDILEVLDDQPIFAPEHLELAAWLADYYLSSLGEALRLFLPPGLEKRSRQFVSLERSPTPDELTQLARKAPLQERILRFLLKRPKMSVKTLAQKADNASVRPALAALAANGFVSLLQDFDKKLHTEKLEYFLTLAPAGRQLLQSWTNHKGKRALLQQRLLSALVAHEHPVSRKQFMLETGASTAQLKRLCDNGLIHRSIAVRERQLCAYESTPVQLTLNEAQALAVKRIVDTVAAGNFAVFLLFGVTGSGKTQVYIEAIRQVLAQGKTAIVLVPEISLTPQAVARFQSNFGEQVAVMHSRLSVGERLEAWKRARDGKARVVVGARSAVFAPLRNLGLLVVDEEHDASYKQNDPAPRYHARDVAAMRAKSCGAVAVLGSATPSAESYFNAQRGKYKLLELPHRIDGVPMPAVEVVDMARQRRVWRDEEHVLSPLLRRRIAEKLTRGEQIILLQNRRGFAPLLRCLQCGYVRFCDNCNIPLTYHRRGKLLRCHYCNACERAPDVCPQCGSIDILYSGIGTQRVEAAVAEQFPGARVARMDLDTTRGKLAHDRILREFGEHRYDVLLGTQMVAKGLDFHRVTLVGVISADVGLLMPDFRAAERTFQLLAQVAGRAGRGNLPGEVIIQTYSPEHVCVVCAREHHFRGFYYYEIQQRQQLGYPPFKRLAIVLFRHTLQAQARAAAQKFADTLRSHAGSFVVYGPTPSPLERLHSQFRYQILLKNDPVRDPAAIQMRQALGTTYSEFRSKRYFSRVRINLDVDPVAML